MCLEFDYWGRKKVMQVPVAKYRDGNVYISSSVKNPARIAFGENKVYVGGASLDEKAPLPPITDAQIQARFPSLAKDLSGRENTTLQANAAGFYMAKICRDVNIAGFGAGYFDLPNAYELAVLYAESDSIDALDPTLADQKNLPHALGMINPDGTGGHGGRFKTNSSGIYRTASSTMTGEDSALYINSNGLMCYDYGMIIACCDPCRVL